MSSVKTRRTRPTSLNRYVIASHVIVVRAEDQTVLHHRFSCAGFVIEAYREAGINVLQTGRGELPLVSLDALKAQYPFAERRLDKPEDREKLGIPGDGPWPVVLAGYVLNALDRPGAEVRSSTFRAIDGDAYFPSRRGPTSDPPA